LQYLISISDKVELTANLRITNVILSCAAGTAIALSIVYVKKSLPNENNSVVVLLFINNTMYIIASLLVMLFNGELDLLIHSELEYKQFIEVIFSGFLGFGLAFYSVIFSGFLGFGLAFSTRLQIQITSPITYEVFAAMRQILQIVIGIMVFKESLTDAKFHGIVLVSAGSLVYAYSKAQTAMHDLKTATKQTAPVQKHAS